MNFFRNKKKEEYLENEIKHLVELNQRFGEDKNSLLLELNSTKFSLKNVTIQMENYKKDNVNLILRLKQMEQQINKLQSNLDLGHQQFCELENQNHDFQNLIQQLKTKKKKSAKKKRQ